jgi:hypothetical protein
LTPEDRHAAPQPGQASAPKFNASLPKAMDCNEHRHCPPLEVVDKPERAYSNLIHGITEMKVPIPS